MTRPVHHRRAPAGPRNSERRRVRAGRLALGLGALGASAGVLAVSLAAPAAADEPGAPAGFAAADRPQITFATLPPITLVTLPPITLVTLPPTIPPITFVTIPPFTLPTFVTIPPLTIVPTTAGPTVATTAPPTTAPSTASPTTAPPATEAPGTEAPAENDDEAVGPSLTIAGADVSCDGTLHVNYETAWEPAAAPLANHTLMVSPLDNPAAISATLLGDRDPNGNYTVDMAGPPNVAYHVTVVADFEPDNDAGVLLVAEATANLPSEACPEPVTATSAPA